jgi:hypothetical protein
MLLDTAFSNYLSSSSKQGLGKTAYSDFISNYLYKNNSEFKINVKQQKFPAISGHLLHKK